MLNNITLVGRIVSDLKKEIQENGKAKTVITLAVGRSYKNSNGDYETDFFDCVLFGQIAETTVEYCKKGDLVGIKGRLENNNGDYKTIVEKLTFLSTRKDGEE